MAEHNTTKLSFGRLEAMVHELSSIKSDRMIVLI